MVTVVKIKEKDIVRIRISIDKDIKERECATFRIDGIIWNQIDNNNIAFTSAQDRATLESGLSGA
jgi:hypothetical protein